MPDAGAYAIWLPTLVLVTVRVAGIFLVAPVFASGEIPARLKAFMSIVMALAVVARMRAPAALPGHWLELLIVLAREAAVGATIGYAARVLLAGVELGAVHIGQQMGIGLADVLDPNAQDTSGVTRRAMWMLAVVIFLAVGGHRAMIAGLLNSFDVIPPAGFAPGQAVLNRVVAILAASFLLALKVAAPVLTALLGATVALGFLQKTMPQCNLLSIGLPVRALLGLLVLAMALAAMAYPIQAGCEALRGQLLGLLPAAE